MNTTLTQLAATLTVAAGLMASAFATQAAPHTDVFKKHVLINWPVIAEVETVSSLPETETVPAFEVKGDEVASMYIICWRNNYVEAGYAGCVTL